jgi:hypothetical protein
MELPELYTLVHCPVVGDLGPRTKVKNRVYCDDCQREVAIEYSKVEYVFDYWDEHDLITAKMVYIATARLRRAIESKKLRGMEFREIWIGRTERFSKTYRETTFPKFFEIIAPNIVEGRGWWKKAGVCETCGQPIWKQTRQVLEWARARVAQTATAPRTVSRDAWQGQDFFFLPEPGPPIVTSHFVEILKSLAVKDVIIHPAKWSS